VYTVKLVAEDKIPNSSFFCDSRVIELNVEVVEVLRAGSVAIN
jgi:hypothetical protein